MVVYRVVARESGGECVIGLSLLFKPDARRRDATDICSTFCNIEAPLSLLVGLLQHCYNETVDCGTNRGKYCCREEAGIGTAVDTGILIDANDGGVGH